MRSAKRSRAVIIIALAAIAVTAIVYSRKDKQEDRPRAHAPDASTDWGGDSPPPQKKPGDVVVFELASEPAVTYSAPDSDDDYRELATRIAKGRARYDSPLSRAAAESAYQEAVHRRPPPEQISMLLLHASGAPDSSAGRFSLKTNDENEDVVERAIDDALSDPPAGDGELYFGVGEAATPSDAHGRIVVVLMTRREFALDPTPRSAPLESTWTATGELPPGYADAVAHVLYPDGRLATGELEVRGRRFELKVATGSTPGRLSVGIDGVGSRGPGKLFQLSVEVGQPLPRRFELELPAAEPPLADRAAAEARALELLAADRVAHGAKPLEPDPELTAIARAHSEDMLRAGFFGHRSPSTGLASDRLHAAGYHARTFGENLAKNDSLTEAERSLLDSVGHRANLLSDEFTHVGVGVASALERGRTQWYVTQLFARPTAEIDQAALVSTVIDTLESDLGAALARDDELDAIAADGADVAVTNETDGLADRLGRRARDTTGRGVAVSIQIIYRLEQLELPSTLLGDATEVVGVAVRQSKTALSGRIAVVVITGNRR